MVDTVYEFTNNAVALTLDALTTSSTVLELLPGQGALFPTLIDEGKVCNVTLLNSTGTVREVLLVTARSGDQLTIVRAQEGTTALAWPARTLCQLLVTAGALGSFVQWEDLGIPYKEVDLGDGGGSAVLTLGELPKGAPFVMIAMTAGAPISLEDITGATLGLSVILSVQEGSSEISIPLDTPPFFLSNISGDVGWPGFPLTLVTLFYNPLNDEYKWVEQARTWRTS